MAIEKCHFPKHFTEAKKDIPEQLRVKGLTQLPNNALAF